jgi:hypothetical protein
LITKEKIVEQISVTVTDLGSNIIKEHSKVCFKIKLEEASQKSLKAAHIQKEPIKINDTQKFSFGETKDK